MPSAVRLTHREDTPIYTCKECDRDFNKYDTPGKCPVCGEWEKLECESCGYKGGAKPFYDRGCKCPKCGHKVRVSGAEFNLWAIVAIVAVVGTIGGVVYLFMLR
ncbi:MAG: hypothetical protein HYV60_03585 [Planctomycetia bacterium]|nr:hypothetical protein [Planctomycetia bacterium]